VALDPLDIDGAGLHLAAFAGLVFGPVVHVDLHGNDLPAELHDKTLAEVVRLTKQQPPS
jgi:hypothetical protein